jgi:hypothetical protein
MSIAARPNGDIDQNIRDDCLNGRATWDAYAPKSLAVIATPDRDWDPRRRDGGTHEASASR